MKRKILCFAFVFLLIAAVALCTSCQFSIGTGDGGNNDNTLPDDGTGGGGIVDGGDDTQDPVPVTHKVSYVYIERQTTQVLLEQHVDEEKGFTAEQL